MPLLPLRFYRRDAIDVAPDLLGKHLVRSQVTLRITEVEAYVGAHDTAAHTRMGRTKRNEAMWGQGGHAYVYLCYGLHSMLNVVVGNAGVGAAVLIRSCEPVAGEGTVRRRRGGRRGPVLLTGPGKVGQALGLDTTWSGHALFEPGGLEVHDAPAPRRILVGARIGIDYASPQHRDAPWRFAAADTPWVTHRARLRDDGAAAKRAAS
jgi:DNA-3-methyladenine glycosylase